MKGIDITKKALEKLDTCPFCDSKLEQTTEHRLECPKCNLHILLEDVRYRYVSWAFMLGLMGVTFSFLIGFIIGR